MSLRVFGQRIGVWFVTLSVLLVGAVVAAKPPADERQELRFGFAESMSRFLEPASFQAAARPMIERAARAASARFSMEFLSDVELAEKMRIQALHVGVGSMATYVAVAASVPVKPLVSAVVGGRRTYRLIVVTLAGSNYQSIDDLAGKHMITCRADDSGLQQIFLETLLHGRGHPASSVFFSRVRDAQTPETPVVSLMLGDADVAVVSELTLSAMQLLNPTLKQKLKTLHQSEPFLRMPVFARKDADPSLIGKLLRHLLDLHKDPVGKQLFTTLKVDQAVKFTDEDIEPYRRLWRAYQEITKHKQK